MSTQLKLCKDCKHYTYRGANDVALCTAKEFVNESRIASIDALISGGDNTFYHDCRWHRYDSWITARINGTCGKAGRYWEAK